MDPATRNRVSSEGSSLKLSGFQFAGSLRFGLASLLVYATVPFGERWMHEHLGPLGAYGVWTLLFISFGGFALKPLVVQARAKRTFWLWFSLAFFAYAASRIASYFTLRGAAGEWLGSLVGSATLGMVLAVVFDARRRYPRISAELFVAHSAGYFLGEWLHHSLHGKIGMLLWGACYGLGFGFGLVRALYLAQTADDTPAASQAD
ncbi:MAG: hypothetical protein EXQ58_08450 [Acidobacteria bacterium]|nr:hypothetical protein [Acidobacteriota bacterium]